jgi:hypothetical protein
MLSLSFCDRLKRNKPHSERFIINVVRFAVSHRWKVQPAATDNDALRRYGLNPSTRHQLSDGGRTVRSFRSDRSIRSDGDGEVHTIANPQQVRK